MLPSNKSPCELIRGGGLICKNDFLGGGLFEGGLFGGGGLFEDLRYVLMVLTYDYCKLSQGVYGL